jgi:hypothetical protein
MLCDLNLHVYLFRSFVFFSTAGEAVELDADERRWSAGSAGLRGLAASRCLPCQSLVIDV